MVIHAIHSGYLAASVFLSAALSGTGALADRPDESDFMECLLLIDKAQLLFAEIQEYGTFASHLWGYDEAGVVKTLERYRFEATFGLAFHWYTRDELDDDATWDDVVAETAVRVDAMNHGYAEGVLDGLRNDADPVSSVEQTVRMQLGHQIWACESAVMGLRYRIESQPAFMARMRSDIQVSVQEYLGASPISIQSDNNPVDN